jgi:hypothetical protein
MTLDYILSNNAAIAAFYLGTAHPGALVDEVYLGRGFQLNKTDSAYYDVKLTNPDEWNSFSSPAEAIHFLKLTAEVMQKKNRAAKEVK